MIGKLKKNVTSLFRNCDLKDVRVDHMAVIPRRPGRASKLNDSSR
ncbi:hypothetical protein YSA_10070 [Pseudomonas putida ND6]|uniref:Uncharacterized protein n=1 Tax=Pseudomonas putida ND6 TaxID=231023 RepID=I3V3B9_PSEPU|nr:hypothetical protein YSA_10070 [Pseudomonas putida ND6]